MIEQLCVLWHWPSYPNEVTLFIAVLQVVEEKKWIRIRIVSIRIIPFITGGRGKYRVGGSVISVAQQ